MLNAQLQGMPKIELKDIDFPALILVRVPGAPAGSDEGMAPPIMKNFMLLASKDEIGDKPAFLVSVSSGMGGSYPIAELRASAGKNNRVCIIPDHMIVRKVDEVLPDVVTCAPEIRDRLRYHLTNLLLYADALSKVRNSVAYDPRYKFGL